MLSALLDGRALTATELACAARVTPQTASTHLAKLAEAGLVAPMREGRYRYFRLASPRVAELLDGIMAVVLESRPRYRPLSRQARELNAARICYDHLAGRLSVDIADSLIRHEYMVVIDEAAEITQAGVRFLTEFGIDLSAVNSERRHFCRLCLGWLERRQGGGAVRVTASGRRGFLATFGIGVPEETGRYDESSSAGLGTVSCRTSGRSKNTKAIEKRMPSADKTDGSPQASIP